MGGVNILEVGLGVIQREPLFVFYVTTILKDFTLNPYFSESRGYRTSSLSMYTLKPDNKDDTSNINPDPSWPPSAHFESWFLKKGNKGTSGIKQRTYIISYPPPPSPQPCNSNYSHGHYITSLKEAKRYFNKTHCSMTFDLFSVDLKPLTPLTLQPVTVVDGHSLSFLF